MLVKICKEKKIRLRVLQGTKSHDLNQLSIFSHYLSDSDLDMKIIETVSEEEFEGIKILYIPEEYPEDEAEFYKEYKSKEYSVIHAHGTWDFVAFKDQIEHSKKSGVHTAPVLMYSEWKNALKNGVAVCGHIHGRNVYGQKIFYSGSFTRWGYGERSERGFTEYEVDPETKKVSVKFIDNKLAPTYNVIQVKDNFAELDKTSIEDIQIFINEMVNNSDNIKIDLTGLPEEKLKLIKEAYKSNEKIKFDYKETKSLLEQDEEVAEATYTKFSYILNRELPIDETIKRFLKEEYENDIDIEKIRKILYKEIH